MTGPEKQDLALVIDMVRGIDARMMDGFAAVNSRLRSLEDKDIASVAVASFRESARQNSVVTKRWIVTAIIAALGAGGGILALLQSVIH